MNLQFKNKNSNEVEFTDFIGMFQQYVNKPHVVLCDVFKKIVQDLENLKEMYSLVTPMLEEQDKKNSSEIADALSELGLTGEKLSELSEVNDEKEASKLVLEAMGYQKDEIQIPTQTPDGRAIEQHELDLAFELLAGGSSSRTQAILGRVSPEIKPIFRMMNAEAKLHRASQMFKRHTLVMLFSLYDSYLSTLLRVTYKSKPEKLIGKDKVVSFEEVTLASDLDGLIDIFIKKEVEKLMRDSHHQQLSYLDKKFKLGLKDNFSGWPDFVESAERRNLFVHTGGVISQQYLNVSKNNDYTVKGLNLGEVLEVDDEYIQRAIDTVYDLSLRIHQGISRRIHSEAHKHSDMVLINVGLDLIEANRLSLAEKIFEFAINIPANLTSGEITQRLFLVNKALVKKRQGKEKESRRLLEKCDWSASQARLVLAVQLLNSEFDQASYTMQSVPDSEIPKEAYFVWPIFSEFIETDCFKVAYEKKFGEKLVAELKPLKTNQTVNSNAVSASVV